MFYTYMLRCEDNSIYTGIATDVKKRFSEHQSKNSKAAKYTRTHTAVKIEAVWQSKTRIEASRLEYRIKKLSKSKKELLINSKSLDILSEQLNPKEYEFVHFN